MNKKTEFENAIRYKLYRRVCDIIHPSISKRNISNYRIVFDDSLLPVRVFYPNKISDIKKIILYLPGNGDLTKCSHEYASICSDLSIELDTLIIAIDYFDCEVKYPDILDKLENIIKYLYCQLEEIGVNKNKIILMGDSTGGNYLSSITFRFLKKHLDYIQKEVLLYPLLSGDYEEDSKFSSIQKGYISNKNLLMKLHSYLKKYIGYNKKNNSSDMFPLLNRDYKNYPMTLILTGDLDPLKDEGKLFYEYLNESNKNSSYQNILYASHGFLNTKDLEIKHEYLEKIKKFI